MKSPIEQFPILELYARCNYQGYIDALATASNSELSNPILQYYSALSYRRLGHAQRSMDLFRKVVEDENVDIQYRANSLLNMGLGALYASDIVYSETCHSMCCQIGGMDAITLSAWSYANSALKSNGKSLKDFEKFVLDNPNHRVTIHFYCLVLEILNLHSEFQSYWKHTNGNVPNDSRVLSVSIEFSLHNHNSKTARALLEQYRTHVFSSEMRSKADYFDLKIRVLENESRVTIDADAKKLFESVRLQPRHKAGDIHRFCAELLTKKASINVLVSRRHGMIGESPQLEQVREQIDLYANSDLNVLIRGASGTGKELVAIAFHQNSRRRDQSFVPVNCFHLGTQLAEARLFGHRKGAFTGAAQDAPGFVHEAHGGTLFLDEVGELPLEAQANLFRFLDSGQFRRVGSTELEKANVRVIAATNQDLSQDSRFRHELYHRLGTVIIDLPPLAERGTDVLHIARCRVAELNVLGGFTKTLSVESERKLGSYDWPGNVRELLNVIDRAWHASSQEIAPDVLRFDRRISLQVAASAGWVPDLQRDVVDLDDAVNRYTARLVQEMHARCNRDAAETARRLNISERTVYRWIKKNTGPADEASGETT